MSTHATTDVEIETDEQPPTTLPAPEDAAKELQEEPADSADDDVTFHRLECPRDGQLLEAHHKSSHGRGRYECPRCYETWEAWEVFHE